MKKLMHKYEFIPSENKVVFHENFELKRALIITNVTHNEIIYSFNSDSLGIQDIEHQYDDNITTLILKKDCSAMSADDELQIFLEEDYASFEPSETFLDPVSKFRVSNPENLIDTDFEYGLQSSKWETLELSNNVPSFFISDADRAIGSLEDVRSTAGSNIITVKTSEDHGLVQGTPIEVNGISSRTAEGKFLIKNVPTSDTFTYQANGAQSSTGSLNNIYTTIIPGQFYSGSEIPFKEDIGIVTDEGNPASLTVTTNGAHGFEVGSNFYLVNSVGTKLLEYDQNELLSREAADGRPLVDLEETIPNEFIINNALSETKEMRSTYYRKFTGEDVDVSNNTIFWPEHGLRNNDTLLYTPSANDDQIGGLERFLPYYVIVDSPDTIKLSISRNGAPTNFTSEGTYDFGKSGLHLVYEIRYWQKLRRTYYKRMFTTRNRDGNGSGWDLREKGRYGLGETKPRNVMMFTPTGRNSFGTTSTLRTGEWFHTSRNGAMIMPEQGKVPGLYNFIEDFTRYQDRSGFQTNSMRFYRDYFDIYDTATSY